MSGQFDLGKKHTELKTTVKNAVSQIAANNIKDVVKGLYKNGIGFLPASNTKYDDILGLAVTLEEIAKSKPEAASLIIDQIVAQKILKDNFDQNTIYAVLVSEPANALLETLGAKVNGSQLEATKLITPEQLLADKFIVFAKTEDGVLNKYLVDKSALQVNTVENNFVGGEVALNQVKIECEVSSATDLGKVCDCFEKTQTLCRTLIAAVSTGIGESSLTSAVTAAKAARGVSGAVANTQSAQFDFADMFAALEAGRLLTYQSANMIDTETGSITNATMAKIRATDAAAEITLKSLQMLGNIGFISNNNYASALSVALNNQIKGGTNRVQKNQLYTYMLAKK